VVAGDSSAQLGGFLAGLGPGSRVAGYLLERLVGAGGTAAVFRARDERLGRVVALKLLAADLTRDEGFRRRFLREARAVAAVDHPHIIPVYEAGEADGVLFIAMRFVAGGDLRVVVGREGGLRRGGRRRFSRRWRQRWMPRMPLGWCTVMSSPRTCWWMRAPVGLSMCTCRISGWPGACCHRPG
jgi:hypothetical protein